MHTHGPHAAAPADVDVEMRATVDRADSAMDSRPGSRMGGSRQGETQRADEQSSALGVSAAHSMGPAEAAAHFGHDDSGGGVVGLVEDGLARGFSILPDALPPTAVPTAVSPRRPASAGRGGLRHSDAAGGTHNARSEDDAAVAPPGALGLLPAEDSLGGAGVRPVSRGFASRPPSRASFEGAPCSARWFCSAA